jgi:uncharacterized protein (DUF488 family)
VKRKIYTIGYLGFSLQDFVATLSENGIECLIDARQLPISRKKGFAKSALQAHLSEAGIEYKHFRLLGSPIAVRHELRESGDYERFFARVHRHIASLDAMEQLHKVISIARRKTCCLMCCCPDWTLCHRKCLVEAVSAITRFSFHHLEKATTNPSQRRVA